MKTQLTTEQINNAVDMFKSSNEKELQTKKVAGFIKKETDQKAKGLKNAIETGRILEKSLNWFETKGRAALQIATGTKLTKEEFFANFYDLKKAIAYRYIQVGKFTDEQIGTYLNNTTDPTIIGLIDFYKVKEDKPKNDKPVQLRLSLGEKKVLFSPTNELSHCDLTEDELKDTILLLQNALLEVQKLKA